MITAETLRAALAGLQDLVMEVDYVSSNMLKSLEVADNGDVTVSIELG